MQKAKPNANTRTLRPDKCLVVSSLSPRLRPSCPRNIGDNAATTRERMRLFRSLPVSIVKTRELFKFSGLNPLQGWDIQYLQSPVIQLAD